MEDHLQVYLYRAADERAGHWLSVRLDPAMKRTALGAVVTVKTTAGLQTRLHNPMTGFLSSNDPVLHFGMGSDALAEEWPR